jgi:hypothetical protein
MILWFYGFSGNFAILFQANFKKRSETCTSTNKSIFPKKQKNGKKKKKAMIKDGMQTGQKETE